MARVTAVRTDRKTGKKTATRKNLTPTTRKEFVGGGDNLGMRKTKKPLKGTRAAKGGGITPGFKPGSGGTTKMKKTKIY